MLGADQFTGPPGWTVNHLPETGSTNDLAKAAGRQGAPGRSVFVTDHQTAGRGRMDRKWLEAPEQQPALRSCFRGPLSESTLLTMLCSVAAAEAIEETSGARVEIKWPNDLMLNGRKLAGLLTEVNWYPDNHFAVVGMGINVNFDPPDASRRARYRHQPPRGDGPAASRHRLLHAILFRLDALLAMDFLSLGRGASRWVSRLWRRRQRVTIADGGQLLEGIFRGCRRRGHPAAEARGRSLQRVQVGDLVV